ncbi:hypothetical protein IUY40_06220 [Flavobacterium sp. ALJ2]|uniref:hypothetical protein n=1 Tax=Flavobacterium sp. ALJ2 TaxID=2786960 RepID=UPI00189F03B6|nr:hypothetical protein [Flavobacterium sp. ALJ2]MBF7091130.1 hypothetical protein [Flavobacterium sp. ALJ2]
MKAYETVIDKRKYTILYEIDEEEMKKLMYSNDCILNITCTPNEDDFLTVKRFHLIFDERKEADLFLEINWLLQTDFYKGIDFLKANRTIGYTMTSGSTYIDEISFGYYAPFYPN